jgi:hypothetical protein
MPFTEPKRTDDSTDKVRKIARLATLLLELRTEYERRPRTDLLVQIKERAAELNELAESLPVPVSNNSQPPALPNTLG